MLLSVENIQVSIERSLAGPVHPVRGASLTISAGETVALVGESGCGKSMTCHAVTGLLPRQGYVSSGQIKFEGRDLVALSAHEAQAIRRAGVASVFQDATGGLNPVRTIGWQIAEAVRLRTGATKHDAQKEAVRLLGRVGLPDPERRAKEYPHQFSGGMNQRAMIALAIAGNPKLLVADEATTALDVTLQAQIVDLITELRDTLGMGVLFVTHDLGLVAQIADRVTVMYAGHSVETQHVEALFRTPQHPYTRGLLNALPNAQRVGEKLKTIDGVVPPIDQLPSGCAFAPRCPIATAVCKQSNPKFHAGVACHQVVEKNAA